MTRLPLEDRRVVGTSGPSYEPKAVCHAPYCSETDGLERHHCWRRSFLGGGFNWVRLPDGRIVANVVRLCRFHHQCITENRAEILHYDTSEGWKFFWNDLADGDVWWPLSPQPPSVSEVGGVSHSKALDDFPEEDVAPIQEETIGAVESLREPSTGIVWVPGHEPHPPQEGQECPVCHRKVPVKKPKLEEKRPRQVWSIRVPKDKEDGAVLLDELVEQAREIFGREEHKGWQYFTIMEALAFVGVNAALIQREREE